MFANMLDSYDQIIETNSDFSFDVDNSLNSRLKKLSGGVCALNSKLTPFPLKNVELHSQVD